MTPARSDVHPRDCVYGLWARSIARFRTSIDMQTRIAGVAHVGTLADGELLAALFELMRGDGPCRAESFELAASRGSMICRCGARSARFSRAGRAQRRASRAGSRTCAAALELLGEQNVLCLTGY